MTIPEFLLFYTSVLFKRSFCDDKMFHNLPFPIQELLPTYGYSALEMWLVQRRNSILKFFLFLLMSSLLPLFPTSFPIPQTHLLFLGAITGTIPNVQIHLGKMTISTLSSYSAIKSVLCLLRYSFMPSAKFYSFLTTNSIIFC